MQQRVCVLFALLLLPAAARAALSHEMDSKLSFTNTAAGESATTVTFKVTYKGTGWFGLGMGGGAAGGMEGSDIVICSLLILIGILADMNDIPFPNQTNTF